MSNLERSIIRWSGIGAVLCGVSGLLGWILGVSVLNSIIPGYKPIAISAAIVFILLGSVQIMLARSPIRHGAIVLLAIALFAAVFGMLEIIYLVTRANATIEDAILRYFPSLYANPSVHISPVAGVLVFLIGLAQALYLYEQVLGKRSHTTRNAIGLLGSAVVLISALFFLSYIYGTPLLYGTAFLPIAALATAAALLLGIGLLVLAGKGAYPARWFVGPSSRARLLRAFLPWVALLLLIANAIQYYLVELTTINPAFSSATVTVLFLLVIAVVILQVARSIGGLIDHEAQERHRVEAELREKEQRLRATFDNAALGIVEVDSEDRFIATNARILEILGYRREELLGMTVHDLTYPDDRGSSDRMNAQLHTGSMETFSYEKRYVKHDGTPLWVHVTVSAIRDAAGHHMRSIGTVEDISERKHAEEELRLLSEALEAAINGVVITDRESRIIWVNPAFSLLTGYSREEALGQNPHILKSGRMPAEFYRDMQETILSGRPWHGQLINRRKDDTLYDEEMTITPVRAGGGEITHFVAIKEDISARKRAEQERERLLSEVQQRAEELHELTATLEQRVEARTAALEASNKELEAFSYSVSHDLRAPLRGIDGFSKILLEKYSDRLDERGADYLQRVRNAAQRMGRLIEDMLNLSRIGRAQLQKERVNLSSLAASVIDDLRQRDPDRHVEVDIMPDLMVTGDPALLRIVLDNLLGNAWKFTAKRENPQISIGKTTKGREEIYSIRDNGAGFDMSHAEKLFSPFQRLHTEEEFPGTGIGLAIVYRIIARHGGRVWAEGQEGVGATVYFTLGEDR